MAMNYQRPGQLGNTNVDTVQLELEITAKDGLLNNLDEWGKIGDADVPPVISSCDI